MPPAAPLPAVGAAAVTLSQKEAHWRFPSRKPNLTLIRSVAGSHKRHLNHSLPHDCWLSRHLGPTVRLSANPACWPALCACKPCQ